MTTLTTENDSHITRHNRLLFTLLAFYWVYIGNAYFSVSLPVRMFHHVVVTALLLVWLARRIRRGLPVTPLNLPLYMLVAVWFLAAAFSVDPRMAFEHVWMQVVQMCVFLALVDLFQRRWGRLVLEAQFLMGALLVLLALAQALSWYFGLGITPDTLSGWFQVIGPGAWLPLTLPQVWLGMGVTTWNAAYAAPMVVVSGAWALTVKRRDFRIVLWALAAGLLITVLLTSSRGGIIALLTAGSALVIWRWRRWWRLGVAASAMALGVVLIISQSSGRLAGDALRSDLWRSAAAVFADQPVLGVGPGMFGRALRDYRDPAGADDRMATAHNLYLNTAAELGIAGLLVGAALAGILGRIWWQRWCSADTPAERLRVEAVGAALLGVAAQSLFDTFTSPAVVSVFLVLIAFLVSGVPSSLRRQRWPAVLATAVIAVYGILAVPVNLAHAAFTFSLDRSATALSLAQAASVRDPGMRLYALQVNYLTNTREALAQAIALEPTWDTGWIILAALAEQQDDSAAALSALDQARTISFASPAALHWARIAEQGASGSPADIVAAYVHALTYAPYPPLSAFWSQTALRREALTCYLETVPPDWRYRIMAVHEPVALGSLVPQSPETAAEWWIFGEHALNMGDAAAAWRAFDAAISRDARNGDYYASRARAALADDPEAARRDLILAELLGTRFEYPNAIGALLEEEAGTRVHLNIAALPPRVISQNFEMVLFNRAGDFDLPPEMRWPGPGRAAMQPWYEIAAGFESAGDVARAATVYRAIADYAPDETEAQMALARLGG